MNYLSYINEINILIPLGTWISIGDLDVKFGILLDSLSMVVMVPVGIVTLLVLFYAVDYMKDDPNRNRFLMILSVFALFMTVLVVSENYIMMFIGWEFVGVISYLLISFWSTRIAANKSALSAVLLNRMGDTLFVICLGTMINVFHAVDFDTISLMTPHVDTYILNLLGGMLLIAATAKSAQLGLHSWLLGAMEGLSRALVKFHYMLEHPILYFLKEILYLNKIQLSWSTINPISGKYNPFYRNLFNFGKIQDEGQSAGNFNKLKGSSETTRETYISKPNKIKNNLKENILFSENILPWQKSINDNFKLWFIGFIEGNDSFIINSNGTLEFKVTQSSIDVQILYYIKKELGFGKISIQDKNNNTHQFRIRDKKFLLKIIEIFNGNIFLDHKKKQFEIWLEGFNLYYTEKTPLRGYAQLNAGRIKLLDNKFKPTLKDKWLLGFTDAEGCFTCSTLIEKSGKNKIHIRYILVQKMSKEDAYYLANIINGNVSYLKSYKGYNVTTSIKNSNRISFYFKNNKLKTKKYLDYLNWNKILTIVLNKNHLSIKGFNKTKLLIENYHTKKENLSKKKIPFSLRKE